MANGIEFHYVFNDGMHSMDAYILNKCESELLAIIKQVSKDFQLQVSIDYLPLEEGGLKSLLRAAGKSKIAVPLIVNLVAGLILAKITDSPKEAARHAIEELVSNPELYKELKEKDSIEKEIAILIQRKDSLINSLNENVIIKRRSNYYDTLESYPRVQELTISSINEKKEHITEKTIHRWEFKDYILASDDLEPEIDDEAIIEIVSPVLKKGVKKNKWLGIYDGAYIPFSMKSNEFKTQVQIGQVSFKNGTAITCQLEKQRGLDQEGNIKIKSYSVLEVYAIEQNEVRIETKEGVIRRVRKKEKEAEIPLFDESDFE